METIALRLYGRMDLRLERFELPPMGEDEILAEVVSDSVCMSSHKAAEQGSAHKRVPKDIDRHPVMIGHEFAGTILQVGRRWQEQYRPGQRFTVQPALNIPGRELEAPGYSFRYIGGTATRILLPREVMDRGCLLTYDGEGFFPASLSEPVSCVIGAFHTSYHFRPGEYVHHMGIAPGGNMAILAGAGPMGLSAIDYTLHGDGRPRLLVVTDIDERRLRRAAEIFPPQEAQRCGVELHYVNPRGGDAVATLRTLSGGRGYDDIFVFAPVASLIEQASRLLAFNGCLNFFAGPTRPDFFASVNFYDIHYMGHHIVGSSGGNTDDMREALRLSSEGRLNPAVMVTHIGGLDAAADTVLRLPELPGAKKLIYNGISLPLTALEDFGKLASHSPLFAELARITDRHRGLWSVEAEIYLLRHAPPIGSIFEHQGARR